ncbi:MAG: hypothetical protein VYA84_20560 [Planctomycetota bacterium]|nr:hypothetical protein [Planctomycetota bacterium]
MNQNHHRKEEAFTLDPPGTIVVVGAGILGIEAGLYGRFLGYNVQILEMEQIGSNLLRRSSEVLPAMPTRLLSSLSESALQAQSGAVVSTTPPINLGGWVEQVLKPLGDVDLLRERVQLETRVTAIRQIPVEADAEEEIPADFELIIEKSPGSSQQLTAETQIVTAEAVILAVGGHNSNIQLGFTCPTPYFFLIGENPTDDWENDLRTGLREITRIYAELGDRATLDLYRPRRL